MFVRYRYINKLNSLWKREKKQLTATHVARNDVLWIYIQLLNQCAVKSIFLICNARIHRESTDQTVWINHRLFKLKFDDNKRVRKKTWLFIQKFCIVNRLSIKCYFCRDKFKPYNMNNSNLALNSISVYRIGTCSSLGRKTRLNVMTHRRFVWGKWKFSHMKEKNKIKLNEMEKQTCWKLTPTIPAVYH